MQFKGFNQITTKRQEEHKWKAFAGILKTNWVILFRMCKVSQTAAWFLKRFIRVKPTIKEPFTTWKSEIAPLRLMSSLTDFVSTTKCWLFFASFLSMENILQVESVRYNDTTPNGCSSTTTHNNNNKFLKQAIIVMPMSQKRTNIITI